MGERGAQGGRVRRRIVAAVAVLTVALGLAPTVPVGARTSVVTSIAALQTAVDAAGPGDVVQLAPGSYSGAAIRVGGTGVTVEAQTAGAVTFTGASSVTVSGNANTLRGFRFASGGVPGFAISVSGSDNLLTELSFDGYAAQKYVVFVAGSQRNALTWSNFTNKPTSAPRGNLVHVDPDPLVPGYHTISHNWFHDMPGSGGDFGNEPIRLGNGAQSTYSARTTVEYNLFENTGPGDSEAISVKSRDNVLRWNTMRANPDAMFVFRNGDDGVAYGNFFMRSGGVRLVEANRIWIYGNHFEYAGVGGSMNAFTYDAVAPNLADVHVLHNTFFEPNLIALGSGGSANTWANNLMVKSSGALFSGAPTGIRWTGNLYRGTLGIAVASGLTAVADPGLAAGPNGFMVLGAGSPAIDRATTDLPVVYDVPGIDDAGLTVDVEGQARPADPAARDVGADERAATAVTNRPLVPTDVGPAYLRFGGIAGTVTDATTRTPLAGAAVLVSGAPGATTDALGRYAVANLPVGGYTLTASKSGYVTSSGTSVTVSGGTTTTANVALTPTPLVSGAWLAPSGGAAVTVSSGDNDGYESGASGLLVTDGVLARDVNSGTGSGTTCTSTTRDRHELVGFAAGLTASTPVRGIEVALRGRADAKTGSPQFCVRLSSDGGLTWTVGRTSAGLTTSLTTYTLGTTTDAWGRTWTGADLGAGFRVQIVDLSTSTARTFSLDSVKVRVTT